MLKVLNPRLQKRNPAIYQHTSASPEGLIGRIPGGPVGRPMVPVCERAYRLVQRYVHSRCGTKPRAVGGRGRRERLTEAATALQDSVCAGEERGGWTQSGG